MRRGQVWKDAKHNYHLVVSDDSINKYSGFVVAIGITNEEFISDDNIPGSSFATYYHTGSTQWPVVGLRLHVLKTEDLTELDQNIHQLEAEEMTRVDAVLKAVLGL